MTIIYGLPGLYQNWLSAALDADADFSHGGRNFQTQHSSIPWISKHDVRLDSTNSDVINCFVCSDNLPWYLFNFFEKTDDVGIRVDHWCEDIQLLGNDTVAYQSMLDHWRQTYNIDQHSNSEYIKNSAIEYFYLFFIQSSPWRSLIEWQHPKGVNIEYSDFGDIVALRQKLSPVVTLDDDHFVRMYHLLVAANSRYLGLSKKFNQKIQQLPFYQSFNVIDLAWLGALFYQIDGIQLDWFSSDVRHQTIVQQYTKIRCAQSNKNVNI